MTKLAFRHGAYLIEPTPHHLNGVGPWTQWLQIARAEPGGGWRVQLFNDAATFPTHAAVVAPCVELGRDIIGGRYWHKGAVAAQWLPILRRATISRKRSFPDSVIRYHDPDQLC